MHDRRVDTIKTISTLTVDVYSVSSIRQSYDGNVQDGVQNIQEPVDHNIGRNE